MDSQTVAEFCRGVIDDVVHKVRRDFVQEGIDETVLEELRLLWEQKMAESGAFSTQADVEAEPAGPGVDTYVPPDPPSASYVSHYSQHGSSAAVPYMEVGKPEPMLHPVGPVPSVAAYAPQPPLHHVAGAYGGHITPGSFVNGGHGGYVMVDDSRKRQRYDAGQVGPATKVPHISPGFNNLVKPEQGVVPPMASLPPYVHAFPQQDGAGDDDGPAGETKEDQELTDDGQSEGALSADDSEEDEEQEADIKNVVVAQFEKVTRSRNKWKCTLKDGVMHVNGREYLFSTAFGEMQF